MSAETEPAAVSSSGLLAGMFAGVRAWSSGRWWWARLPLLIAFAYILVRHLGNAQYQSIFKPLNLGVHELGHFVFAPLGDLLGMAGGTLLQCLVPVASMAMFCRQRDYFAITAGLGWLATNLFDVAVYVGDARAMALPLVTPGGGYVIHDWNFLLGRMGILRWDTSLALGLRCAAVACLGAAILAGSWIVWLMLRSRKAPVPDKYPHLSGSVYG